MNAITQPAASELGGAFKVTNLHAGEARMDLSKQWASRPADQKFLSLDDLFASVNARAEASSEQLVDTRKVEIFGREFPKNMAETNDLYVGLPNGDQVSASHWSFGQLASLAKAPASYLRTLPASIVGDNLKWGLRYNRGGETVKSYTSGGELLAATGPDYGRIFDREVVDAVRQVAGNGIGDSRWKVPGTLDWSTMIYDPNTPVSKDTTTLYASDRDVFMFLVDDRNPIEVGKARDGQPDLMFRGFYVSNSEVGNGSLRVAAFYLRALCCNRIMWGTEGFEEITMRHSKYAPSRFIDEATPALISYANGSDKKLIEGVARAKAAKVAANDEEALAFLASRDFSATRSRLILDTVEREEGAPARSIWDLAQGITAVARNELNSDTRLELEMSAKRMLDKV